MSLVQVVGSGFPLVLFHGWGVDASVWQPLIPRLKAQYALHLVELFDEQLAWPLFKKTLLNQLPERFGLLGWSMGGLYATRLALEESTRVSHLINVASSPCFIESDDWPGISRDSFMSFYNDWLSFPDKTQQNFIKQQCGDAEGMYSINSQMALRDGLDAMLTWDFREDINSLCMPTAYLFGRLDRVIARHTMRAMQVHYPPFNYHCFTKAAHMPFISSSLEFDVWLTNFYSV